MSLYCDNAALHPLLSEVKEVIRDFLDADYCNPSAIYSGGRKTRVAIEQARETVAKAIGADTNEIYFTSGATEAIVWIYSNDDHYYYTTTQIEHKAVLRQNNVQWDVEVDEEGLVNPKHIANVIENSRDLVVVGWVNNEIGTIQPIKEIAEVCKKKNAKVFVDATQAIGHIPIDVHELGIDYLCGSFGKLGGLSGCGFLYAKKGALLPPLFYGGGQERGKRSGTENVLGILAGAKAIEIATRDIEARAIATKKKRDRIIYELLKLPKTQLNGSLGNRVCNNINIAFEGVEAETLVLQLNLRGISASAGSACNSANMQPSHVLKAIGLSDDLARSSVRFTIGDDITDEEVEVLIDAVRECVEKLRQMSPKWKE